jgi:hypothetical protein
MKAKIPTIAAAITAGLRLFEPVRRVILLYTHVPTPTAKITEKMPGPNMFLV